MHAPETAAAQADAFVLPSIDATRTARAKLLKSLPAGGLGVQQADEHLRDDVLPGLNRASQSPHYYGFVTGGVTLAAASADNLVTETDQNVQVHLPTETIATDVEDRALHMLCELLDMTPAEWPHKTFTTGATASNVVGLACGREHIIRSAVERSSRDKAISVAEHGLLQAMSAAGLTTIRVLTTVPHSSLKKAASVVGLGRASVVDVGRSGQEHRFDLALLKRYLEESGTGNIVVVSCAEVNTGRFATDGEDMQAIRDLCDRHGAWLHVDAAFGLLARALPRNDQYSTLRSGVAGLEMADSIAGDAHKLLNVPYDCGIFLSKHLDIGVRVFQNTNAAYLNTASSESTTSQDRTIPSPLNIGLENSRRFRALPVYATLAAYGREGYREMLQRQIALARGIASHILQSDVYELLPRPQGSGTSDMERLQDIYIIVLFRAKNEAINPGLVQRINGSRKVYVSGTSWEGKPAVRFAIANWQADAACDLQMVKDVLVEVTK